MTKKDLFICERHDFHTHSDEVFIQHMSRAHLRWSNKGK